MKAREPRRAVMIAARIRWSGRWSSAVIRNVSSRGLMLCTPGAPPRGTYVEIRVGKASIVARVVWAVDDACGLTAQSAIDIAALCGEAARTATGSATREDDGRPPPPRARRIDPFERAERSRRISYATQFAVLCFAAFVAAGMLSHQAYRILSAPADAIGSRL